MRLTGVSPPAMRARAGPGGSAWFVLHLDRQMLPSGVPDELNNSVGRVHEGFPPTGAAKMGTL